MFSNQLLYIQMSADKPKEPGTYLYKNKAYKYGNYKLIKIERIEQNELIDLMYEQNGYWFSIDNLNGYFSQPLFWDIKFN